MVPVMTLVKYRTEIAIAKSILITLSEVLMFDFIIYVFAIIDFINCKVPGT